MIQQTIDNSKIESPKEHFELFDAELNKQMALKKETTKQKSVTPPPTDYDELENLKKQFGLLNAKLEKQRILSEEIVNDSMKEKLSHVEKWYQGRFAISLVSAPIVGCVFLAMYLDRGIEYWGFGLFILAVGALEYFLNKICYKRLDVKGLPALSMTEATENIVRHKQMRSLTNRIMAIPYILLVAWTILIASNFVWKPTIALLTVSLITISIICGLRHRRANKKRLEEILKQIERLRD